MKNTTRILNSLPVDPLTGSIAVPIYQTSTFVQSEPGIHQGFDYARTNNPTRSVIERLIAELEYGHAGFAFSSGLAAIDAVLKLLSAGDEIVAVDDIYGGAYRLFTHIYAKFGIKVTYVDSTDLSTLEKAITASTKLIWIESPTNPTLKVTDIGAVADIAKKHQCWLCVDNTFATPLSQQPILAGADLVVHSATKYLGGHSDLIAGLVVTANKALSEKIKFIQNGSGAILAPFDSWLVIRGIETLELRLIKHSRNAQLVAEFLETHRFIHRVYYPGLPSHPNYKVAQQLLQFAGGIISFDLVGDVKEQAYKLVSKTRLFKLAESLGGAKSLICLPCEMTHKSLPRDKRYAAGVTDSLIRISVGLESHEDLIADLQQALLQVEPQILFTA